MVRRSGKAVAVAVGLVLTALGVFAFQKPFRQYPGVEHFTYPLPPDWNVAGDFVFARLMYPNGGPMDGYYPRFHHFRVCIVHSIYEACWLRIKSSFFRSVISSDKFVRIDFPLFQ